MLDSTVLTDILGAFVNGSSEGFPLIKDYAESLFAKLIIRGTAKVLNFVPTRIAALNYFV